VIWRMAWLREDSSFIRVDATVRFDAPDCIKRNTSSASLAGPGSHTLGEPPPLEGSKKHFLRRDPKLWT